MGELTTLIASVRNGDDAALGRVYELLYTELRQIAHARLRRSEGLTLLDTTSLVNESYLKLVDRGELQVEDRLHFLAYAARTMRSIVVDVARRRLAERRGGDHVHVTLSTGNLEAAPVDDAHTVRVHEALQELARIDERLVQVVEMRFFAGLDHTEIAEALGVSTRTVERAWEKARLYLFTALK